MALNLTLEDYFRIAMASGVVSAIVTALINWALSTWNKSSDAVPSLVETANALDSYSIRCQQMLETASRAEIDCRSAQSYEPLARVSIPDFEFPERTPWTSLNKGTISALKGLPVLIASSRAKVRAAYIDEHDPLEALEVECGELAKLGLHAFQLATELRTAKGLPLEEHQRAERVCVKEILANVHSQFLEREKRIQANNAATQEKLNAIATPLADRL